MSAERWFAQCDEVLARIRTTQREPIRKAAQLIIEAAAVGAGVYFFDTGHCSGEPIHRAGGLYMLRPLRFSLTVDSQTAPKRAQQADARRAASGDSGAEELAALAVERSALAPGDVLIINSVSGKSARVVEVARAAQRLGARVVAISSVAYSSAMPSRHSSGNRLFELADVVVDNCGTVGDAALDMEGVDTAVAPTSGVAFCYIIWALVAEVVAGLTTRGLTPHVYRSVNLPDGEDFNARAEQAYQENGI